MGNLKKLKWTEEEEEALKAGVTKHGPGKWKNILVDPQFASFLSQRSNIDLKDKWRNMYASLHGSRERVSTLALAYGPISCPRKPNSNASVAEDHVTNDPSKTSLDEMTGPRYETLIFEALSTTKDSSGSNLGAIASFIEQRLDVPQNFRRSLSSMIRRLILQGKLEKVQNRYMIKESASGRKTPTPRQNLVNPRPETPEQAEKSAAKGIADAENESSVASEDVKEAAITAAKWIVYAENTSFVMAKAIKEAEEVFNMAEAGGSMLQLYQDIYEKCSGGRYVECLKLY